ncbi:hypothetical protein [Duganella levis]|uniref:Uncharacterized protein n=1 Tax=Duganella levis TaxID=2692169 RepID=A0ABW9VVB8_9BURK|nr:hypothetical protein [Duganella levis]MYN25558.1 hypothetical protein [Duganella levis]
MSNYETLFNEILALTRDEKLSWQQISRKDNAGIILNAHLVIRQFSTTYRRGHQVFTLLLLEKRHLYNEETSFMERLEGRRAELLILENEELVISLREMPIKLARMMELMDLAIDQSDKVRRILGAPV